MLDTTPVTGTMPPLDWNYVGFGVPDRTCIIGFIYQFDHVEKLFVSAEYTPGDRRSAYIGIYMMAWGRPDTM
jgi:hypothetical protein